MANKPDCEHCSAYKYCDTVISSVKLCNSITNKQESKNIDLPIDLSDENYINKINNNIKNC